MDTLPTFSLLRSRRWRDYELLDSGDGCKLERFGPHLFVRPEVQALWSRSLPSSDWDSVAAVFQPTNEESGGHWSFKGPRLDRWQMKYDLPEGRSLRFWAMTIILSLPDPRRTSFQIPSHRRCCQLFTPSVLNLFGYTGLLYCLICRRRVTPGPCWESVIQT
jgi:23S rRNA (cytosine1962-C5)-methyltransferase